MLSVVATSEMPVMLPSGRARIHNESGRNRIAYAKRHNGGNSSRLGRDGSRITKDHDDIDLASLQFLHQMRELDGLPGYPTRSFES